jgi:hypothetical protein
VRHIPAGSSTGDGHIVERRALWGLGRASLYCLTAYLGLADKERAFEWLDRAYQDRSFYLVWLDVSPVLDALRPTHDSGNP